MDIEHSAERTDKMATKPIENLYIGKLLKVIDGIPEKQNAKWIETGDIVRIIGIYPHHILVEKTKASPFTKYRMRECFSKYSLHLHFNELKEG